MELRHIMTAFTLPIVLVAGLTTIHGQGNAQSLLAAYPFVNGSPEDQSGNGHDGVFVGNPQIEIGIRDEAVRFDGIDDHMRVATAPELAVDELSLSLFVKIDDVLEEDGILAHKMRNRQGFSLWISAGSGDVNFALWNSLGQRTLITSPYAIVPKVWTAISISYDGTNVDLYMHGALVASLIAEGIDFAVDSPIYFGRNHLGGTTYFKGIIDQIGISEGSIDSERACISALKVYDPTSQLCLDTFKDITEPLGIGDPTHRHFGIATVDINQDGWIDIYYPNGLQNPQLPPPPSGECPDLSGGDPPYPPENVNTLFLNNGDGTFTSDIAPQVGLDDYWNGMRNVWGDYDNDGKRDLFSHNFIVSPLYKAVSGPDPLLFEDYSAASEMEVCETNGTGASWVDLNHDGYLDMYAVEYAAGRNAADHVNLMFLNDGDGTFTDITEEAGVNLPDNPMGIAFADYDNDGDQDVFVTNSHEPPVGAPSRLYRHDGVDPKTGYPSFTDVAAEAGVDIGTEVGRGFGVAWGDFDNDGRLDMLYAREADSRLFRNVGDGGNGTWIFRDVTERGGLNFGDMLHQGCEFADINNDGWLDILMCNGQVNGPNQVFLNNSDGTWTEVASILGMDVPGAAMQGVAPADLDNDGDLELVWYDHFLGNPNLIYDNEARGNNWIQFRLTGTVSNRDAVGARIKIASTLEIDGPRIKQMREITAGSGFFDDIPRIQTFGLGKGTQVTKVEINWPSGITQFLGPLTANERYDIVEPASAMGPDTQTALQEEEGVARETFLGQNYPNPFNPTTNISYDPGAEGLVSLKVFNVLGEEIVTLVNEVQSAGTKSATWDGKNSSGTRVPSGVYVYRLSAGKSVLTEKMILMK